MIGIRREEIQVLFLFDLMDLIVKHLIQTAIDSCFFLLDLNRMPKWILSNLLFSSQLIDEYYEEKELECKGQNGHLGSVGLYSVQKRNRQTLSIQHPLTSPMASFRGFPCSKVISCASASLCSCNRLYLELCHTEKKYEYYIS